MTNSFTTRAAAIEAQTEALNKDILDEINREMPIGMSVTCKVILSNDVVKMVYKDMSGIVRVLRDVVKPYNIKLKELVESGNITTANLITILNFLNEKKNEQCPEFPYFGASYPDARCIDGSLHDLDDSPGYGQVYLKDEDFPCPFCRPKEYIKHHLDPLNGVTRKRLKDHIEYLNKKYNTKPQ